MRKLAVVLSILAFAVGFTALVSAAPGGCPGNGKGKSDHTGPQFCKYCPEPEPGCVFFECSKCGCTYTCNGA